jgi:hypothetical protein
LTTEHWSLLATRSLTWNEIFARSSTYVSALSGALVALALLGQISSFGESFTTIALLILPTVFFLGLTTYVRLVKANLEDFFWVTGMNRIRAGYLEVVPEVAPYLTTSPHDDVPGFLNTVAAPPGASNLLYVFVTTPTVIWVINSVLAGAIVVIATSREGMPTPMALGTGVICTAITILAGLAIARRKITNGFTSVHPLNPIPAFAPTGDTKRAR